MKSSAVPPPFSTFDDSLPFPPTGPSPPVSSRNALSSRRLSASGDATSGSAKLTGPSRSISTRSVGDSLNKSKTESIEGNLQLSNIIESTSEVMCVRYSPDGSVLAVGSADGSIKVCSSENGQCLYAMNCDDMTAVKLPVTNIRFCPSSSDDDRIEHSHMLAASYASGHVRFWHYSSGTCVHTTDDQRSQTMSLAFNSSGTKYATVGSDPQVYLYDAETKKRVCSLDATDSRDKMDGHRARVFAVVYHPTEPHVLLSGGWDDTVQYWDERQRHAFRKFYGPHICGDALDIDPVHGHILTGSWRKDCPLQIWDFGTGDKIKDVPQDVQTGSQLYCAQWVGRDSIACGGCLNNMARVIDRGTLNTVSQMTNLPQGVYCLDNDRQGSKPKLAVGASLKVYQLKPLLSSTAVGGSSNK